MNLRTPKMAKVALTSGGEINGLRVRDSHDVLRILVGVNADEIPWVIMHDDFSRPRVKMTILPDGTSGLYLHHPNGETVVSVVVAAPTTCGFTVFDTSGSPRALLGMAGAEPTLMILDENGNRTVNLP